jgi:hypothetical protein
MKTASFRLRRFRNPLKNHGLGQPQAQNATNIFPKMALMNKNQIM